MKKSRIARYVLDIKRTELPKGRFKMVFLSDMHNCLWGENGETLLEHIEEEKPDLVLCGGDMLVAYPGETVDIAAGFLKRLSEKYRVYYALGNHEYRLRLYPETYGDMYERYMDAIKGLDICILDNDNAKIQVNNIPLSVYGLSLERKYFKRFTRTALEEGYIEHCIGAPSDDTLNILMAHTPKYLDGYFRWGADITLCGHYHGGVMGLGKTRGLVSPDPSFLPNARGCISSADKWALISAGLGEHTIPVRVNNPRELVSAHVYINER